MRWKTRGSLLPVAIIVDLIGAGLFVGGFLLYQRAAEAAAWPAVDGTVIRSDVRSERRTASGSKSGRQEISYFPVVAYRYQLESRTFEGDKIRPGVAWGSHVEAEARAEAGRYPVGAKIRVHVNPRDSFDACLEPTEGAFPVVLMSAGGMLLMIGSGLFFLWIRRR